jgi:hypothetical protein
MKKREEEDLNNKKNSKFVGLPEKISSKAYNIFSSSFKCRII